MLLSSGFFLWKKSCAMLAPSSFSFWKIPIKSVNFTTNFMLNINLCLYQGPLKQMEGIALNGLGQRGERQQLLPRCSAQFGLAWAGNKNQNKFHMQPCGDGFNDFLMDIPSFWCKINCLVESDHTPIPSAFQQNAYDGYFWSLCTVTFCQKLIL